MRNLFDWLFILKLHHVLLQWWRQRCFYYWKLMEIMILSILRRIVFATVLWVIDIFHIQMVCVLQVWNRFQGVHCFCSWMLRLSFVVQWFLLLLLLFTLLWLCIHLLWLIFDVILIWFWLAWRGILFSLRQLILSLPGFRTPRAWLYLLLLVWFCWSFNWCLLWCVYLSVYLWQRKLSIMLLRWIVSIFDLSSKQFHLLLKLQAMVINLLLQPWVWINWKTVWMSRVVVVLIKVLQLFLLLCILILAHTAPDDILWFWTLFFWFVKWLRFLFHFNRNIWDRFNLFLNYLRSSMC